MNVDFLKRFSNQNIERRPTECAGETVGDLNGNVFNQPMDAGFSYAVALKVANSLPTTVGSDPYAAMVGATIYGTLPTDDVPFDVNVMDELYEANFKNYPNFKLASFFVPNAVKKLYSYNDISKYLHDNRMGVSLAIKYYDSFLNPNQDGSLPSATGNFTYHNCAIYEDTILGLRAKMYLGPEYGDHGYVYISRTNFDLIFQGAYAFDPDAWRWLYLAKIAVARPYLIPDILPLLSKRS